MSRLYNVGTYYKKHNTMNLLVYSVSSFLILLSSILLSCGNPLEPVDNEEEERVKAELKDRSFRQFAPSVGAVKRKGVILDFFDNEDKIISLWAQYSDGDTAINEWEIFANDYRVEKGGSEYRLYFEEPHSHQNLPNNCDNCIESEGISISVRNLFDNDKIEFKLNDPDDSLGSPFPVFKNWTRFNEDEYFD